MLAACLFVTSLSLVGLTHATQVWHAYVYDVGLGIASGGVTLLFFAAWGKLYGNRELGRIQGVAQMLTLTGEKEHASPELSGPSSVVKYVPAEDDLMQLASASAFSASV